VRALYKQFPGLADTLPVHEFANLPTPVRTLPNLREQLKCGELWLKQDDRSSQLYGGNKVRKLEFLLADAEEQEFEDILTFGAAGSNHALATALYAKEFGFNWHVVLSDQPKSDKVTNTLRQHLRLGSDIIAADGYPEMMRAAQRTRERAADNGRKTYQIPFGGSSTIGTIGFVNAAFELKEQIESGLLPEPEFIYLACGTSGSATGLSLGLQLAGLSTRVIAVEVTPEFLSGPDAHIKLFKNTMALLKALDPDIPTIKDPLANIEHRYDQFGDGYAMPTEECEAAVKLIKKTEGVVLETTYTGKAFAAMLADIAGRSKTSRLFWNTYNSRQLPDAGNQNPASLPDALQKYFDKNS